MTTLIPAPKKAFPLWFYLFAMILSSLTSFGVAWITAMGISKKQALQTAEVIESKYVSVFSGGHVDESAITLATRGSEFTAKKLPDGVCEVVFPKRGSNVSPIIAATAIKSGTVVSVIKITQNGFMIQGTEIDRKISLHVPFTFIAIEPQPTK